jgi:16S rRNA (guanine527-N7)-methyltransferase
VAGLTESMRPPESVDPAALLGAAQALDVELTQAQADALLAYMALLSKWNRVYNLSAIRDPAAMLVHHVIDSLAVAAPLRRRTGGEAARLLDVGSGAGLPGAVLAVAMPELEVTCIDAVGKKAAFVREVAGALALPNLHSLHGRVEQLEGRYDIVASRAFASLTNFVHLTRHLLDEQGRWLAMKGKLPSEELALLPAGIEVFHVEHLAVPGLAAERCLVWMKKVP